MRVEQRKEKKDGGWNKRKEGGGEAKREGRRIWRTYVGVSNGFRIDLTIVLTSFREKIKKRIQKSGLKVAKISFSRIR